MVKIGNPFNGIKIVEVGSNSISLASNEFKQFLKENSKLVVNSSKFLLNGNLLINVKVVLFSTNRGYFLFNNEKVQFLILDDKNKMKIW